MPSAISRIEGSLSEPHHLERLVETLPHETLSSSARVSLNASSAAASSRWTAVVTVGDVVRTARAASVTASISGLPEGPSK